MITIDNKSKFFVLVSLLVGVLFSIHWIIPKAYEMKDSKYEYLPVRYHSNTLSDDYFYYSRIRDIIDGKIFSGDHSTYEHQSGVTPHLTYTLSFMSSAIGALFTGRTDYAYFFTHFIFPALGTLLLLLFFDKLGLPFYISTPLALFLYGLFPALSRTPNNLVTNVFLLAFTLTLFGKIVENRTHRRWDFALILLLGLSSVTSIPNMFLCYFIFTCTVLVHLNDGINKKGYLKILGASLLVSSPGFYVIISHIISNNPDWTSLALPPISKYSGFHAESFLRAKAIFLKGLPYCLGLFFLHFPMRKFLLSLLFSIVATYLFISFSHGSFSALYVFNRGGEVLYYGVAYSSAILSFLNILETKSIEFKIGSLRWAFELSFLDFIPPKPIRHFAIFSGLLLSTGLYSQMADRNVKKTLTQYKNFDLKEFKELTHWSRNNLGKHDVIVSLDFDLITNIGIYSPGNTYIAFAHHSPASTLERFKRLIETMRFHGATSQDLLSILKKVRGHGAPGYKTEEQHQMSYFQLIMFYGKGFINHTEAKQIVNRYINSFKGAVRFSYKSDYLIMSRYSMKFIREGSLAQKVMKSQRPLFDNKRYQVYKLQ